jgi:hypothetical protein
MPLIDMPSLHQHAWCTAKRERLIYQKTYVCRSARDVAAPAYSVLARSGFATLERLAGADAKHADR